MGLITSRQNIGVEEVDININNAYKYPPKSGNYFSTHFIMGGERFETAHPEMYLFGENMDLNFLRCLPSPFPYTAPSPGEPSRTLKALVNIRKESLRFVRIPDDSVCFKESESSNLSTQFNIEFTFDCDVRCAISIRYFCVEDVTASGMIYTPKDHSMSSETYHYKKGSNQQFSQMCHVFDPTLYPEESLVYSAEKNVYPIVIYCVAEEGDEPYQSHVTIAVVEKHSDGYFLKPLKQKLFVDGLCYLLQEIYGIENKHAETKISVEEEPDDNGAECVICMCDLRDTLILPCRHLCLCNCCADSLRFQANNCPICRVPFRALLQIKALQKIPDDAPSSNTEAGENVPAGYEPVSLIEALNGPSVTPQQPPVPLCSTMYMPLPQRAADADMELCGDATRVSSLPHRVQSKAIEDSNDSYKSLPGMTQLHDDATKTTGGGRKRNDIDFTSYIPPSEANIKEETSKTVALKTKSKGRKKSDVTMADSETNLSSELKQEKEATNCILPWNKSPPNSPAYVPFSSEKVSNPACTQEETENLIQTLTLLENLNVDKNTNTAPTEKEQIRRGSPHVSSSSEHYTPDEAVNAILDDLINVPADSCPLVNDSPETVDEQLQVDGETDGERQRRRSLDGDSTALSAPPGSHSLPGTPISRSSDISSSSASSTKALILSNPTHLSTTV